MSKVLFYKWQGAGNDFILLDGRNELPIELNHNIISLLCNRHFGIGADGLIVIKHVNGYDFRMTYYNSDGYEADMCGNGARCITGLSAQLGLFENKATFLARDGIHFGEIITNDQIKVSTKDVGIPEQVQKGYFMNTGVPHLVVFVDQIEQIDVENEGTKLRFDPLFGPDGTNVNFVQLMNDQLLIRTFERGVEAETLACGTGVVASALAASLKDTSLSSPITCKARGGTLKVSFKMDTNLFSTDIWLEGPAKQVFTGYFEF